MRKLFFSVFVSLFSVFVLAAQDMASLFKTMPREVIFLLTDNNRKDLVDLFVNKKDASVLNVMGGETKLLQLNDNFLKLQLTEQNTVELKLLPAADNSKIICMVQTACAPVCDSRISFYSIGWMPLNGDSLIPPFTYKTFLNDSGIGTEARENALTALDTRFFRYELNPDNTDLLIYYTTPDYLGLEEREKVAPYLTKQPLVMSWNHSSFQ
ncbi:MAG: DUF3256 family protein [Bacteroidales bacterium]|nr:DUF3256 family protein [Bacteroidales bacterium]